MANTAALFRFSLRARLRAVSTWVLATVFLSLALTSVLAARYSNELLASLADPAIVEALQHQLHPPTITDVWGQWLKNLTQIASLVMVVVAATTLRPAGGPAVMILARGVSRRAYLSVQASGFFVASFALTITSALVLWLAGTLVFDATNPWPIIAATLVWWLQACCFVLVALLAAAAGGGIGASAGAGIGAFFLATLLTWWPPALRYSPAGLGDVANSVALGQSVDPSPWWPILVSVGLCLGLWALAAFTFARREI